MERSIRLSTHEEAQELCGPQDEYLRFISKEFKVKITLRADRLKINGTATNIKKAETAINYLLGLLRSGQSSIERKDLVHILKDARQPNTNLAPTILKKLHSATHQKTVGPKTKGQREYVEAIKNFDIVFGLGPAGTGKTYLAMASAVEALNSQQVRRIILTRPALEAGESLGFLPGDMYEKISPYLRPLYDALYDMMEPERIERYLETGIIEVAPLAYMRGRTLNDAFIILDEAQNCTPEQLKMFLTRLGFDSKAVITGDLTQSDLPGGRPLGLLQAQEILKDINGIKFIYFSGLDVVRHALVQRIIEAYEKTQKQD